MFARIIEEDLKLLFTQLYLAEELFKLTDKNREFLREWLPWLDQTNNVEDTKEFIKSVVNQAAEDKGLHCTIVYQGKIVGVVGYNTIDKNTMTGQIGYWLDQDSNGKGIMTKCVREMINVGFELLKLKKVEIRCAVENTHSRAIPERLSLKKEGVIRSAENLYGKFVDQVVYGVLDVEWKR